MRIRDLYNQGCTVGPEDLRFDAWLNSVRQELARGNMRMDDWQARDPYNFRGDFAAGITAQEAAQRASAFWWKNAPTTDELRDAAALGIKPDQLDAWLRRQRADSAAVAQNYAALGVSTGYRLTMPCVPVCNCRPRPGDPHLKTCPAHPLNCV